MVDSWVARLWNTDALGRTQDAGQDKTSEVLMENKSKNTRSGEKWAHTHIFFHIFRLLRTMHKLYFIFVDVNVERVLLHAVRYLAKGLPD